MGNTHRYICALFLTAALAPPVAIMAAPRPQAVGVQVRVYDRSHKDYHNWDDRENHAWGVYLTNTHHKSYEFSEANKRQQASYWNWRHSHPDKD